MNPRTRRALAFWQEQDWRKPNVEIARLTGRNKSMVSHWRSRLGKPSRAGARKRSGPSVAEIQTRFPGITGMTYRAASKAFGISMGSARTYAKALGEGKRKMGRPRKAKTTT